MPKGEIKKIHVNKDIFIAVLNERHYSIRRFCEEHGEICSDRTLRRSLNAQQIRFVYVDNIAKILDVDPRFLTGEIIKIDPKMTRIKNPTSSLNCYLAQIKYYPYARKELDDLRKINISDSLKTILSLFDFSYKQFEDLEFDVQYNFQHDLLKSISTVLAKYFQTDGYGNTERPALETLILDLESYYENECLLKYADTILRDKFIQSPPKGYSINMLQSMSRNDILDLDIKLQWHNDKNSL